MNKYKNWGMQSYVTLTFLTVWLCATTTLVRCSIYDKVPVLVTGGCGFIGSHLVDRLVELGALVTVLDNNASGLSSHLARNSDNIIFVHGDVTDYQTCLAATRGQKIVFHLAALTSVNESMSHPVLYYEVNSKGTLLLLEAARINDVERFVFSSSAAVYGPTQQLCYEDMACFPASPYGYSKLIGELLCCQYAKTTTIATVMLRYFNVYGDRQNPQGTYAAVVAKFSDCMVHNMPITIFGDGLQTRDFIPVDQVVQANIFAALLPANEVSGRVFNIATGTSITLLELIEELQKRYPLWHAGIIFQEERAGDIKSSRADCRKYQQLCAKYQHLFDGLQDKRVSKSWRLSRA
jgi:UDP-glucose 4-epimerase